MPSSAVQSKPTTCRGPQFSLKGLLMILTGAAASFALAASYGLVALVAPLFALALYLLLTAILRRSFDHAVLSAAFLFAGLILMSFYPVQVVKWQGSKTLSFSFTVVDGQSRAPISSAVVSIAELEIPRTLASAATGADGVANLQYGFTSSGEIRRGRHDGSVALESYRLEVRAPGYEPLSAELAEYTGRRWNIDTSPHVSATVALRRSAANRGEE